MFPAFDVNKIYNLSGSQLVASSKAMDDFIINESRFKIENFDIQIYETREFYRIRFIARLAPGEIRQLGGGTSLGRSVQYFISKDFRLISKNYFR